MLKFSIITCTLNSAFYIKDNIKSVQEQTYKNFEHIFIDGYSKDGTSEILTKYQQEFPEKVKIYIEKPCGISAAMNKGIKEANGDYLIHLHSDDSFFDKNVLQEAVDFLENKSLDWVYGQINVKDQKGTVGIFPNRRIWQADPKQYFKKYLLKFYNYIPHQAVFIKKEVFEKFGYFDEKLTSAMDPDFWLRIWNKTRWQFFKCIISNYKLRFDSQSASLKNKKQNQENYRNVQKKYLNFPELIFSKVVNYIVDLKNKNFR